MRGKKLFDHLLFDKLTSSTSDTTSDDKSTTSTTSVVSASMWDQEDNLIVSLMIASREPSIGITLVHLRNEKLIW